MVAINPGRLLRLAMASARNSRGRFSIARNGTVAGAFKKALLIELAPIK
jgi:hypothetical protein